MRWAPSRSRLPVPRDTESTRKNLQPSGLHIRTLGGKTLYSHVVIIEAKRIAFISGQLPRSADGAHVGVGDMRKQIEQVGQNLMTALSAIGCTLDDLICTKTYVTDIDEFFKHADVREKFFGPGMPASTTVEVRRLSHPDFMVEVDAIATTS